MKRNYFLSSVLFFVVLWVGAQQVVAGQEAVYYKAGDVGAFAVDVTITSNINIDATVFTAQASDKKAYLLYPKLSGSIGQKMTDAMESEYHLSAEQEEIQRQMSALYKERGKLSQQLSQAKNELDALKGIKRKAEKDQDNNFADKTQLRIEQLEAKISELEDANKKIDEQFRTLGEGMRNMRNKPSADKVPEQASPSLRVFGRFQGNGQVKLSIYARNATRLLAEPNLIALIDLDLPSADAGNPDILKQWATAQAQEFMVRVLDSPYTSYYQYCLLQSKDKYGLPTDLFHGVFPEERRDSRPDLYSMTTGALAIQESLQLEEMMSEKYVPSQSNVPVRTLAGPGVKSHPFDQMLKGKTFKMFPIDTLVPYDNYYCHFTSISKEIAASDLIKQWGTSLLRAMTVTARDADLPSRYMEQLCIDISALTRLFGDLVIGEIAITGGDPFLREGSDIALIIQVKNNLLFDKMMKSYADKAIKINKDVKVSDGDYNGITIHSIVTADHRISSHSAYLGSYKVYSNSMDTLKLIIDTNSKKRKSMADNLDFQYMRTIFPGTAESEDGFIYLSDSFIRKMLSAGWKVEARRRIICQNHLRMIGNAATMYRTEMRKQSSIAALIEQNYLSNKTIECPDGGKYSLDESGRAFCTVHNCLQYCTAVSSIPLNNVTVSEADDYKKFVESYNNYWRKYFDPIGIRFKLGNHIEVETCILPLIQNSIYNQLREIAGGTPVQMSSQLMTDGTIASISSKLNFDNNSVQRIGIMEREMAPLLPALKSCVGNNVSLNFYDSDVLFTFSDGGMGMFGGWMNLQEQIVFGLIASSINLPVYAVVDLKDEQLAKTFMQEMLKTLQLKYSVEHRRGFPEFEIESYSAGEYKNHEINTLVWQLFVVKFRLHYAIASNRLIVSTKRYVLEKALDAIDNKMGKGEVANVQLDVKPRAFDKLGPIVKTGWQERMRDACLKNLESIRVFVECHDATEQSLDTVSKKVEGVTLRCPSGGAYKYDVLRGIVYCSIHGDRNHPRQPVQVSDNEGLLDFITRMTDFSVKFRFTEEGIMTKVAFDLESKDSDKRGLSKP